LDAPADPTLDRLKDWVYGGEEFLRQMVQLANDDETSQDVRRNIRTSTRSIETVIAATAKAYEVDPGDYAGFRSRAGGRDVAAYLCGRYTTATLAELSKYFGLSHRDSSGDLVGGQNVRGSRMQRLTTASLELRNPCLPIPNPASDPLRRRVG
jgi:hypothetical protein